MNSAEDTADQNEPHVQDRPTRLSCEGGVVFGFDAIGFSEKFADIKEEAERLFLLAHIEGLAHKVAAQFNGVLLETNGDGAILWAPQLDENAFHAFVRGCTVKGLGFRSGALQAPAGTLHIHSYYIPERGNEPIICFSGPAYKAIQDHLRRGTPPLPDLRVSRTTVTSTPPRTSKPENMYLIGPVWYTAINLSPHLDDPNFDLQSLFCEGGLLEGWTCLHVTEGILHATTRRNPETEVPQIHRTYLPGGIRVLRTTLVLDSNAVAFLKEVKALRTEAAA